MFREPTYYFEYNEKPFALSHLQKELGKTDLRLLN